MVAHSGSIPACAGEPRLGSQARHLHPVYPRVCGGTSQLDTLQPNPQGLSPRVRGNPAKPDILTATRGSIPACAGEPAMQEYDVDRKLVYPRVCGGTNIDSEVGIPAQGLSPRVRGNRQALALPPTRLRSIPACAGEPGSVYSLYE